MGAGDRRLFACPALIPRDLENGLFAAVSSRRSRDAHGSIPRENPLERGNRAFRFISDPAPALAQERANREPRRILGSLRARFPANRKLEDRHTHHSDDPPVPVDTLVLEKRDKRSLSRSP